MPHQLLFITTYTGLGGGETSLLTLVEHLDPARFRPHLLVPRDGQLPERWRASGFPVHILPFRGASTYFIPAIWGRFPITGRMAALIRSEQIAAIHSDYHSLPFAVFAGARIGIPVVWTCGAGGSIPNPGSGRFFSVPRSGSRRAGRFGMAFWAAHRSCRRIACPCCRRGSIPPAFVPVSMGQWCGRMPESRPMRRWSR
ncbi:MAG: glycosyltransferase family 4 protein [bacterium]|nr:glycosyltransferase family 4 protein [bacterium]